MKNIHFLFDVISKIYFCHLQRLINLNIKNANSVLIALFHVKGRRSVPLHAASYNNTVLLNDNVTCVQWPNHVISCDPVSSNRITIIYIGVI